MISPIGTLIQSVQSTLSEAANIAGRIAQASQADLAREIPSQMLNRRMFSAQLNTLKTQDEMLGELVDLIG